MNNVIGAGPAAAIRSIKSYAKVNVRSKIKSNPSLEAREVSGPVPQFQQSALFLGFSSAQMSGTCAAHWTGRAEDRRTLVHGPYGRRIGHNKSWERLQLVWILK